MRVIKTCSPGIFGRWSIEVFIWPRHSLRLRLFPWLHSDADIDATIKANYEALKACTN